MNCGNATSRKAGLLMPDDVVERRQVAERIRQYWDACGDLITTQDRAQMAFDHLATEFEAGIR